MGINKDIDRLKYTFSKGNKINQNDIQALNGLIEYVNDQKERELNNHHLFAKVIIYVFKHELIRTDGNYHLSLSTLNSILRIDLDAHFDSFHTEINTIAFNNFCKTIKLSQKHPALLTESEREIDHRIIKENEPQLIKLLDHYKKESVFNRLTDLINGFIEKYK